LLQELGTLLKDTSKNNVGLALRWEAGLCEMERLFALCDSLKHDENDDKILENLFTNNDEKDYVKFWTKSVNDIIQENAKDFVEVYEINSGIVSVRLRKGDGGYLSFKELKAVYQQMTLSPNPCYLGQPVDVAQTFGIVRIAFGTATLRLLIEDSLNGTDKVYQDDLRFVKKLADIVKEKFF